LTLDGRRLALALRHLDPVRHGAQMNANGFVDGSVGIPLLAHAKGDGAFFALFQGAKASGVTGHQKNAIMLYYVAAGLITKGIKISYSSRNNS
jgi:RNA:NAD 2'-phosphotransferase (TPT1/KptA family)